MAQESKQKIGVIGAGTMGRGIVQLFAQAGHVVCLYDADETAVTNAKGFISSMLKRGVEKGRISQSECNETNARVVSCSKMSHLADCGIVIEAIIENISIKQKVFAELEETVSKTALLCSNTSSLIVAEIASKCRHPERVVGLHFFNPVPLMKVAEVISAVRTSQETVNTLLDVIQGVGHRAVVAEDQPGFLVNHAGRGLYTEGLRIVEENVASPEDVDTIMRESAGFRMGPFELLDLTGLDVSGKVMESIYEQFQQEARFRPSSLVPPRIAAGLFGRKTGEGWYKYENNKKIQTSKSSVKALPKGIKVWIDPSSDHREDISTLAVQAGASLVTSPNEDALLITQPWGKDGTQACIELGIDPQRCVCIDPLPSFAKHRTLMLTPVTAQKYRDAALAIFTNDGVSATVINDSSGFVVQRVLATIVNIATNIAQRRIASVADIEDAVTLGLGYPLGPLTWGDKIGGDKVLLILDEILKTTGDPRYRASPWLRRRVQLSVSLLTPESNR